MRPKRPLPVLPSQNAATPQPERCRGDHRGQSSPGASHLRSAFHARAPEDLRAIYFGACRCRCQWGRAHVSVAHELSGLGSTRVVRFSASGWRRIDEPGDVATGPTNAEVSGRFEPLGTAGAVDDGSGGAAGNVGAPVSTLPGAV